MVLSSANKPRVFRVVFSDPNRTFYSSGDKVSGSVQLEASAPCRLRRLRVTVAGCARVESLRRSQEVEYLKYEDEVQLDLILNTDSDGYFLLPAGKCFCFQFGFELPPPGTFYSSGDKVSGSVQLEASAPCRLRRLRVTVAGCARVENLRRSQEVEYLKYEDEVQLDLILNTDSDGYFLLPAGKCFCFQFGFELPPPGRLVSSFIGKFGSVRYYVSAELQRPSQHALQCKKEFEVEEPLDVNRPDLLAPVAASRQKKLTCLFIPDGQVSVSAQIDRKGFCEGEDININATFQNTCSRIVVPKAAIVARHSYCVNGTAKILSQKLAAVRGNAIMSGMCDMWQGRSLRVPKLKPTLLGCDIIKVDYALMVYLHIPGSEKLVLELPLVIGTIPFSGVGSRTGSMSSRGSASSGPPSYSNIHQDLRADGPRMPLLYDYDDDDMGFFIGVTEGCYPAPPAYSEVDEDAVHSQQVF